MRTRFTGTFLWCGLCLGWLGGPLCAAEAEPPAKDSLVVLQEKAADRSRVAGPQLGDDELPPGWPLTFEEVERLYLDGDITARMFQKYILALEKLPKEEQPPPITGIPTNLVHEQALQVLHTAPADPSKNPPPGPALRMNQLPAQAAPDPAEAPPPVDEDFVSIESKMDKLLQLKTQRERVGQTNQVDLAAIEKGEGMTKRDRLNQLLRLYAYGKISEEDYNRVRARIIAEP